MRWKGSLVRCSNGYVKTRRGCAHGQKNVSCTHPRLISLQLFACEREKRLQTRKKRATMHEGKIQQGFKTGAGFPKNPWTRKAEQVRGFQDCFRRFAKHAPSKVHAGFRENGGGFTNPHFEPRNDAGSQGQSCICPVALRGIETLTSTVVVVPHIQLHLSCCPSGH